MKRGVLLFFMFGFCVSAPAAVVKTEKKAEGWRLLVDGKPYFVKGMCYSPTRIGEDSNTQTRRNWLIVDDDQDGRNDFAYQTWVDANRDNKRDPEEKDLGDFELMRRMGVNTIRLYHHLTDDPVVRKVNTLAAKEVNRPEDFPLVKEQKLLNDLFRKYGIRVAMGDLLGSYTVSSGADWETGTDYADPTQRANMLKSVEDMVRSHKDQPYLLMWILGNENDLEQYTHTKAIHQKEAFTRFVNEAAVLIKKLDGKHPVALCLGGNAYWLFKELSQFAPDVDIFGINLYRERGFSELWQRVADHYDRPVLLTEYGTGQVRLQEGRFDEDDQERVHRFAWEDIERHQAGQQKPGNAIGGFVFEWVDEWWPSGDPWRQNPSGPGQGDWNFEYNGMASLGDGAGGSLVRQPRKVYGAYRNMWQKK